MENRRVITRQNSRYTLLERIDDMDSEEPTQQDIESFRRLLMHLPGNADLDLIILKGHLLIEEQLRSIIEKRIPGHKVLELEKPNWQFSHVAQLAEALCHDEADEVLWSCVGKLNKIRNKLAHNLEPKGLSDQVDDFNKSWPSGFDSDNRKELLHLNLWSMHTILSGLVKSPVAKIVKY